MYKYTRKEGDNKVKQYFLILNQGLKTKHFYWEFVNSLRKVLILISFVLPFSFQIVFSTSILIITWKVQDYLKPYKKNTNNDIEILALNAGVVTLLSGLVYNIENQTHETLNFL